MPSTKIPICPTVLPSELVDLIVRFAGIWASHDLHQRVAPGIRRQWVKLLDIWAQSKDLPLLIRRPGLGRGSRIKHQTGRILVPTDNTPANWSLSLALTGACPTLPEVRAAFRKDQIPVAMVLSAKERKRATYTGTRSQVSHLNAGGWKVAHIDDVALGRGDVIKIPIEQLREHFVRFLSPANMFLVPKEWAGIAELPIVSKAMRYASAGAA